MSLPIHPQGPHLLVQKVPTERVTKGGIVVPETSATKRDLAGIQADILAIGPLCFEAEKNFEKEFGTNVDLPKVGDRILTSRYAGFMVEFAGEQYQVITDTDVIAVLTDTEMEMAA